MSTNWDYEPFKPETVSFPSDNLRSLYAICERYDGLDALLDLPRRIRFVIDSNAVIQELLWITKTRRDPSARTSLREVMDCGLVVTIAPTKVHEEINRHIPGLASENSVSEEKLNEAWEEFQVQIEFREVEVRAIAAADVVDPDDVEFVTLSWTSGADAVLTEDKHISMMGAKAVRPDAMLHVRDYARSKAPEVAFRVGGVVIGGVAVGSVVALVKLVTLAVRTFSKLPVEIQIALIGGAIFLALHPGSRKIVSNKLSSLAESMKVPAGVLVEAIGPLTLKFGEAQLKLKANRDNVERIIPRRETAL